MALNCGFSFTSEINEGINSLGKYSLNWKIFKSNQLGRTAFVGTFDKIH